MLNQIGSLLSWRDKRKIGVVFGGGAARSLRSLGACLDPRRQENNRHLATPPLVSPRNDVWETSATGVMLLTWWSKFTRPIRSTTQICKASRNQYGISALIPQTSFREETSGGVAEWRLFCEGRKYPARITIPPARPAIDFDDIFSSIWKIKKTYLHDNRLGLWRQ